MAASASACPSRVTVTGAALALPATGAVGTGVPSGLSAGLRLSGRAGGGLLCAASGGTPSEGRHPDDVLGAGSVCAANLDLHPLLLEKLKAKLAAS